MKGVVVAITVCFLFGLTTQVHAQIEPRFDTLQTRYFMPKFLPSDTLVYHQAFVLRYNETHEQACWVAYRLCASQLQQGVERTNKFMADPLVVTGSAQPIDYAKSGFDRGHLVPAADMAYSIQTMAESFYYSNMSPQLPEFNRGVWKKLEEQVRDWAKTYDTLFITTGPVLEVNLPTIGPNKVSVPNLYYKAILAYTDKHAQAIAFIVPNRESAQPVHLFEVTVDSLEHLVGFDFFAALPDELEAVIEAKLVSDWWDNPADEPGPVVQNAVQPQRCKAITKSGKRCSRKALPKAKTCKQHQ